MLAAKPGEVIPHAELLTQVWGPDYAGENLYLKLYIRYLRQKIEGDPGHPRYILTRRGAGYYLDDGRDGAHAAAGPNGHVLIAGTTPGGWAPTRNEG